MEATLLSRLKDWISELNAAIFFFILIFFCIVLLFFVSVEAIPKPWDSIASTVAKTMLAGGTGAMLLKVLQIGNVFRREIESIIYDERFTSLRSDRVKVWANFTKALYAERFPGLSKSLSVEDMKSVLPTDRQFYFRETSRLIVIEPDAQGSSWIRVKQESTAIIVTESGCKEVVREKEFKFDPLAVANNEDDLKRIVEARCARFWKLSDNGSSAKGSYHDDDPDARDHVLKSETIDGRRRVTYQAKLQGNSSYYVEDSSEAVQNLAIDNTIAVVTLSYLIGLEVAVSFDPSRFVVQFHEVGGARFFDVRPDHHPIHKKTNQVLFSDAGFFLTVQRKS